MTHLARDDSEKPPALAFDAWAELSARLVKREPEERLAVLDAAAIDADDWDGIDAYWVAALAAEIGRGVLVRAERYGQLCAQELLRRGSVATGADGTVEISAFDAADALPFTAGEPRLDAPGGHERHDLRGATVTVPALAPMDPATPFEDDGGDEP